MTDQVITIGSDGSMAGLQRKPGQGIDLRKFGKAKIERASEILWNDEKQQWYVEFKAPINKFLTLELTAKVFSLDESEPFENFFITDENKDTLQYFKEYDDAVKAEIRVLDYLRLKGLL